MAVKVMGGLRQLGWISSRVFFFYGSSVITF